MAGKRGPTSDLNHDNWDKEEEAEERGTFREADENELRKRAIKKARRRIAPSAQPDPKDADTNSSATKSLFSGFQGFNKAPTTAASSSPFSFLSNLKSATPANSETKPIATNIFGSSTSAKTATATSKTTISNENGKTTTPAFTMTSHEKFSFNNTQNTFLAPSTSTKMPTSGKVPKKISSKTNDENNSYLSKIAKLNIDVSNWIKMNVDKNPYCLLTPILKDYEKYLQDIKEEENIVDGFNNKSKIAKLNAEDGTTTATATTSFAATKNNENATVTKTNGSSFEKNFVSFNKKNANEKKEEHLKFTGFTFDKKTDFSPFNAAGNVVDDNKPSTSSASFVSKTNEKPQTGGFTFGTNSVSKPGFSFGTKTTTSPDKPSTGFSFGMTAPTPADKPTSGFAFNTNASPTSFSFGSSTNTATKDDKPKTGFSFGSSTITTSTDDKPKTGFSFGSSTTTTSTDDKPSTSASAGGFSFGSNVNDKPGGIFGASKFQFNYAASPPKTTPTATVTTTSSTTTTTTTTTTNEENEDEPPKVEFTQVVEEDSIFSIKCKVFVKKGDDYTDRGVGTLHLKPIKDSKKTQLLVRADTNLGNILVNFILNKSIPSKRMGKNNVMLVCLPTPDFQKPTPILLRVKTSEIADELLKKIDAQKCEAD